MSSTDLVCIDQGDCDGPVEYRMPLSGPSFPRCDKHWFERFDHEMELRQRYPDSPPDDWDPYDAGETW